MSVEQLSMVDIQSILEKSHDLRQTTCHINQRVFAANLFFEPSTRTKMSFVVAQKKLGMDVLDFNEGHSSAQKGESLYDTMKTFEAIGTNLLVVRHPDSAWFNAFTHNMSIPIINGGAGKSEHPTQSMLDLDTIYQEFGRFDNLDVAIIGDIKHSRVARSNAKVLDKLGAHVYLCAPPGLADDTLDFPYIPIDEAVENCDVVMLLRIQHERHHELSHTNQYLEQYGLTKSREQKMKPHAIIMHPAPVNRGVEIDSDLIECRRSRIFQQMSNGVPIRMAIMIKLLQEWGMIYDNTIEKRQHFIGGQRLGAV